MGWLNIWLHYFRKVMDSLVLRALNMANKNLAIEYSRGKSKIVCLSLHPGTTDTDLSKPYQKGVSKDKLFSTKYSVMKMMEIIDNSSFEDSGRFIAWDGSDIPF